jgi:hypothetical protein
MLTGATTGSFRVWRTGEGGVRPRDQVAGDVELREARVEAL